MTHWLVATVWLCLGVGTACSITSVAAAPPDSAVREQRERELALVQHLRRHLRDPGDGLALAADRRDLQRTRAGIPGAPATAVATGVVMTDTLLLETLAVVADLWHIRMNDRVPFRLMPRDRLSALARAQEALGQLQSRTSRNDRDRFLPEMLVEVQALSRLAVGQGEMSDQAVDLALHIADGAVTGRPLPGPSPYPMTPPGAGYPPPGPAGTALPPGSMPPSPPPPSGGPSPYELPPGYAGYAPAPGVGFTECQTLRQSAGVSGTVTDMLRAAECWSRQPTWRGWALQVHEALDWAAVYARLDRDCDGLETVSEKVRELGSRTAIAGLNTEMTSLAGRAEQDRGWLRAQKVCR